MNNMLFTSRSITPEITSEATTTKTTVATTAELSDDEQNYYWMHNFIWTREAVSRNLYQTPKRL